MTARRLIDWYLGRRRTRVEIQLRRIRRYHGAAL